MLKKVQGTEFILVKMEQQVQQKRRENPLYTMFGLMK